MVRNHVVKIKSDHKGVAKASNAKTVDKALADSKLSNPSKEQQAKAIEKSTVEPAKTVPMEKVKDETAPAKPNTIVTDTPKKE